MLSEVAVRRGGMREDPGRRARRGRRLLPTHGDPWQDRWGRAAARTLPMRVGTGCCPSVDSSRVVGSSEVAVRRGGMREDPVRRVRKGRRLLPTHGGRWQDRWGRAAARTLPTRVGTGCCPSVDSSRVGGQSAFRHLDRSPCRAALHPPTCPPFLIAPSRQGVLVSSPITGGVAGAHPPANGWQASGLQS